MVSRERDLGFKLDEPRDFRIGTKVRGWGSCPVEKNETIHSLAWGVQGAKGDKDNFRGHNHRTRELPWGSGPGTMSRGISREQKWSAPHAQSTPTDACTCFSI